MNNPLHKIAGAAVFSFAVLITGAKAQMSATSSATQVPNPANDTVPAGLLGKNYATVEGFIEKFRHASSAPTVAGPIIAVNQAVAPNFDFGLNYAHAVYDFAAGVEVPVYGPASLRASIAWEDSFKKPHTSGWVYEISGNYWITRELGASVGVDYINGHGGAADAFVYKAGVNVRF